MVSAPAGEEGEQDVGGYEVEEGGEERRKEESLTRSIRQSKQISSLGHVDLYK